MRQVIDLALVLARSGAQFEQPRFYPVERLRIVAERFACADQLVLRLARLDHRAVERGQRFGQQGMLSGDPVQPPRRAAQGRQRRIRSGPQVLQFREIARQALPLLHRRARFGELFLLAHFGFQRGQFGQMRQQQIVIGRRLRNRRACAVERFARRTPCAPGRVHRRHISSGIAVHQQAVPARIDQSAIIVLPVQFHQLPGEVAQQRRADRLIVDEGLGADPAAAIGAQAALQDQRLTRFNLHLRLAQHRADRQRQLVKFKAGDHARLIGPGADQLGFGAVAQHQPQRIEQDRFARPGLTREHAEPFPEIEVKRFDQHHIANRQPGQHVRPNSSGTNRVLARD